MQGRRYRWSQKVTIWLQITQIGERAIAPAVVARVTISDFLASDGRVTDARDAPPRGGGPAQKLPSPRTRGEGETSEPEDEQHGLVAHVAKLGG
jgi:hypothetical protein